MIRFNLTSKELARVQRAAEFAGFPWRPICTRPKTARQFYKRVEAEMHCEPKLSRSLIARQQLSGKADIRIMYSGAKIAFRLCSFVISALIHRAQLQSVRNHKFLRNREEGDSAIPFGC